MSFFTTSDNKAIETGSTFDMNVEMEPIPTDTKLKSFIDEIKWDSYEGDSYISARWTVIDGEYKNRKIFQKLRVTDSNPAKADKAKRMLAAIDGNAGGKLMAQGVQPDDMMLSINLMNKPMLIVVAIWEIEGKKGNWVKAVSSTNNAVQSVQQQAPTPAPSFDDDIAF